MYKFALGTNQGTVVVLIMKPEDFQAYRAHPLDDHTRIDFTNLGRPDVHGLITYANSRIQARQFTRQHTDRSPMRIAPERTFCFSGQYRHQKLIGIILTDVSMRAMEQRPLQHYETFEGNSFGVENFRMMITFADRDRGVVHFLREMGMPMERIAADPDLRPLWLSYGREAVDDSIKYAAAAGVTIPVTDSKITVTVGKPESGISTGVLLAVRGAEIAWFAQHPSETEYHRRAEPGEFPPDLGAEWVRVVKADENTRLRFPMKRIDGQFVDCKGDPEPKP